MEGRIEKALSGFYYVNCEGVLHECRAVGKLRHQGMSPLVGDLVEFSEDGIVERILPRKNCFIRPSVANVDALVFVATNTKPITDPFLIDRVTVIAEKSDCQVIVCINKQDLDTADELYDMYSKSGFQVVRTSAETGEGISTLREAVAGKVSAFTGNSGVGKSSILNRLIPGADLETGEISDKLGRGKHTTRHVELYRIDEQTYIADTPGFASFDIQMMEEIETEELAFLFPDFRNYISECRFRDCRHISEPECQLRRAVSDGAVIGSRYDSYVRLYDIVKNHKPWD